MPNATIEPLQTLLSYVSIQLFGSSETDHQNKKARQKALRYTIILFGQ
jgi:hypothetical protein